MLFICLAFERYQNARYTKSYVLWLSLGKVHKLHIEKVCGTYVYLFQLYAQKVEVNLIINVNFLIIDL